MTPRPYGRAIFSPTARRDIRELLQWSVAQFGTAAAFRYSELLKQAIRDIEADPYRLGSKQRPELPADVYTYHLAGSRDRVDGGKVRTPRHFLVYRPSPAPIEILRVLHDSRDLARHLPEE